MKTTLELPDDLVKKVKLRALREGRKLKDAIADLLQKGLAADMNSEPKRAVDHHRQENRFAGDPGRESLRRRRRN